jgi:hypothetical protein
MNTRTKKRKRPVKKMSDAERLAWLRSVREMTSVGRAMRNAQAERWRGHNRVDPLFGRPGDVPESGGTDPADFFSRRDNGSV